MSWIAVPTPGSRQGRLAVAAQPLGRYLRISALPLAALVAWSVVSVLGLVPEFSLPTPVQVASAFWDLAGSGRLFADAGASLLRILAGVTAAVCVGVPFGLLAGWFTKVGELFEIPLHIIRPVPPIAWVPFAVIWFHNDLGAAAFVVFLGAFFPIAINSISGVRSVERRYLDVAATMRPTNLQMLRWVVFPGALPSIFTGIRVGVGIGWMTVVAAEFFGQAHGLGALIIESSNLLRMDRMVVGMTFVGLIGLAIDLGVRVLARRVVRWRD